MTESTCICIVDKELEIKEGIIILVIDPKAISTKQCNIVRIIHIDSDAIQSKWGVVSIER